MPFCGLVVFFKSQKSISLSTCTTVCWSSHLLKDILVASKFWQMWIKLLQTSVCRFLCGHKFPRPLGRCQGTWLLDHLVFVLLYKKKLPSCLPKWLHRSVLPPAIRVPVAPHPPQHWVLSVLDCHHSNRYAVECHYFLNLHFSNDIQCGASFQMFICHLNIFFNKLHVKVFGPFLNQTLFSYCWVF